MSRKIFTITLLWACTAFQLIAQKTTEPPRLTSEGRLLSMLQTLPQEISDDELTLRIAQLYTEHASLLKAEATGKKDEAKAILDKSMITLNALIRYPGVSENIRFRELYRTIISEYEQFYGATNPDFVHENDEIFQLRAEVFSEINDEAGFLLESVDFPEIEQFRSTPPPTVFPMDIKPAVASAIQSLSKRKTHFRRVRTRADIYFPMIEKILAEEGVPDELKYLAMVESALNPRAQSWARAVGLWQFIPETGSAYGLNITRHVDERRDPEKSTRAAAKHLKDLFNMFDGDWQLAIAGYNCNPVRVRRELRKAEDRLGRPATFWDIMNNLPRETRDYVPLFIATYYILNNPGSFDLGSYPVGPRYEYDVVPVPMSTSLESIASQMGTSSATLRALNPELLSDITPTSMSNNLVADQAMLNVTDLTDSAYLLRVPLGFGYRISDVAVGNIGQVRWGTGYAITASESVAYTSSEAPDFDEKTEHNSGISEISSLIGGEPSRASSSNQRASSSSRSGTRKTHRVARGETLSGIAALYGVSLSDIRSWNNIRGSTIRSGQRLVIYSNRSGSTSVSHRVSPGDNLTAIARRYGTTVTSIKRLNGLDSSTIRPGQVLKVK